MTVDTGLGSTVAQDTFVLLPHPSPLVPERQHYCSRCAAGGPFGLHRSLTAKGNVSTLSTLSHLFVRTTETIVESFVC